MKIGCLLGVSQYKHESDLPACKNDIELIEKILKATSGYDEVLCLATNQPSSKIKQQIVSFLTQFKDNQISQVLFYFTGHGDFDGKEFYYLLNDFETSRRKQTAIENSELDEWLRILNPELTVKIVDACHAGVQYIKDPEAFGKYLHEIKPKAFKNCYFMYSSQKEEYSYQDHELSHFTRSFAKSIANFSGTEMRFKDVIDYISDDFETSPNQTPLFVTQATNTETFTAIDGKLRHLISQHLSSYAPLGASATAATLSSAVTDKKTSLIEFVKTDAKRYCTKDELMERLEAIKKFWDDPSLSDEVSELYNFDIALLASLVGEVPRLKDVGKWLAENKNDYFAEPTYTMEEYTKEIEVPMKTSSWLAPVSLFSSRPCTIETVTRERKVCTGYHLTQDTDFVAVRVAAIPKFQNLKWHDFHLVFVFSKTEIRFFYLFSVFKEINWAERKRYPVEPEKWRMLVAQLKDQSDITHLLEKIVVEFGNYIMEPIRSEFLPSNTDDTRQELQDK